MFRHLQNLFKVGLHSATILGLAAIFGCSNMPFTKLNNAASRTFLADFSTAWTSVLETMGENTKFSSRESGIIESNWIDNSTNRQFLDIFTDEHFFLRSRYRLMVQVREGKKDGDQAVLVRVLKQMQKETTFLGGWQDELESDNIEESVFLYRVGRLIAIQQHSEEQNEAARKAVDDEY